jgi:hypothetical protein
MGKLVGCPGGGVLGMYAVLLELCFTLCLPFPQRGLLKLAMAPKVTVVQVKSKVGVGKTTQSKKTIGQTIVKKPSCQEEKTIGQTILKQRQLKPARERGEYLKEWCKTRKATRTVASSVFRVRPFSLFFEQWMTDHPRKGNMSLTLAGKAWRAMSKHNKELWSQKAVAAMDEVKDHAMPSSQPASGDASVLGDDQVGGMTPGADAGQTAAGGQTRNTDVDKAAVGGQAPDTDFGRGTAGGEAPGMEEQPVPMTMRIHCGAYTAETTQQTRLGVGLMAPFIWGIMTVLVFQLPSNCFTSKATPRSLSVRSRFMKRPSFVASSTRPSPNCLPQALPLYGQSLWRCLSTTSGLSWWPDPMHRRSRRPNWLPGKSFGA